MRLREPELPFLEISFQNKTVSAKADSPPGGGAHEGQKVAQGASLAPWALAPLPPSCCLFQIRLQNASPLPSCWRLIPQASSPSSLEGLGTHLPGANTRGGSAAASSGQKRASRWLCAPRTAGLPHSRPPLGVLPPASAPQPRREPSLGRAILIIMKIFLHAKYAVKKTGVL